MCQVREIFEIGRQRTRKLEGYYYFKKNSYALVSQKGR
jgi:hypothetical protein